MAAESRPDQYHVSVLDKVLWEKQDIFTENNGLGRE